MLLLPGGQTDFATVVARMAGQIRAIVVPERHFCPSRFVATSLACRWHCGMVTPAPGKLRRYIPCIKRLHLPVTAMSRGYHTTRAGSPLLLFDMEIKGVGVGPHTG